MAGLRAARSNPDVEEIQDAWQVRVLDERLGVVHDQPILVAIEQGSRKLGVHESRDVPDAVHAPGMSPQGERPLARHRVPGGRRDASVDMQADEPASGEVRQDQVLSSVAVKLEMAMLWRDAVNRRGGDVTVVHLPQVGIRGNTHFPFSDLNSREIADLLSAFLKTKHLD